MSDPPRLLDPKGEAPPALQQLFAAAASDLPTDAALGRVAARLGPLLDAPAPPAAPPPSATGAAGTGALVKAGIAVAVVAAGAMVLMLRSAPEEAPTVRAPPSAAPSTLAVPADAPSTTAAVPRDPAENPVLAAPSSAAAPSSVPTSEPSAARSGTSARAPTEAELLERARAALGTSPSRALALSELHRARFPTGVLAQEREVIAIEALKRLGRGGDANGRSHDFSKRYPDSAYRPLLDAGPR